MATADLDNNAPLKMYLHELSTIPPLTNGEEASLLQHVRTQDDQAKSAGTRLVEAYLSLVVSIAERHSSAGISILDLIQEGNLALEVALRTFTGGPRGSFSSYAASCVEQAISKAIAESRSGD